MAQTHESGVRVTRWTPTDKDRWAKLVGGTEHSNLAHAPEWFGAIQAAYRHVPVYLQVEDASGESAALPAFHVRRGVFGSVVASMPFLDGGGPCATVEELARVAVQSLIEEAARLGAGSVELRSTVKIALPVPALEDKVNMVLPLSGDAERCGGGSMPGSATRCGKRNDPDCRSSSDTRRHSTASTTCSR